MKFEESRPEFELAPKGTQIGSLYLIADIGTQKYEFNGSVAFKPAVWLGFELTNTKMQEGDNAGKPFVIGNQYKVSTFDQAPLPQLIMGWQNVEVKPGFALKPYLGMPGILNIVHNAKGDKTYANIDSVMPLMAGMVAPPVVNSLVYFDLDEFNGKDHGTFNLLPPFIQKKIQASPEYKEKAGTGNPTDNGSVPPTPPVSAYRQDLDDLLPANMAG